MSTPTLLTVEQFEQLPEQDGVKYELSEGELIQMPVANSARAAVRA